MGEQHGSLEKCIVSWHAQKSHVPSVTSPVKGFQLIGVIRLLSA